MPCVVLCAMLRKGTNITTFNEKKIKWENLSDNYCNNSPSLLRTKSKEINVGAFKCTQSISSINY